MTGILKNKLYYSIIFSLIIPLYSCQEEDKMSFTTEYSSFDRSKLFLKLAKSDDSSLYYISGNFEDIPIYCASTWAELYPYQDTTFNAMYSNATGLDELRLTRENHEMSFMIAFYIEQPKIKTRQFPYVIPHANPAPGEFAQVDVWNLQRRDRRGSGLSYDECLFSAYTYNNSLKIQITNYANSILEGTYEGTLTSKTGSHITIKNGTFRLKIKEVFLE